MCFSSQLLNFNLLKTLTHFIKVRPDEAKLLNPGAHVLVAGEGSSGGGEHITTTAVESTDICCASLLFHGAQQMAVGSLSG